MPYRKKGSGEGKWKTQRTKWAGENNPNYKGKRTNTECHYCHKLIYKYPSHAKKAKHAYCSHECYAKDRIDPNSQNQKRKPKIKLEDMHGENHPRWNGIKKFCKFCNKELVGRDKRRRGYCSDKCKTENRKLMKPMYQKMALHASQGNHKKFVDAICSQCKCIYKRGSRNSKSRFCSRACVGKWCSENKSGENSPLWKGGTGSYEEYPEEFNLKFRYSIRKRDNFTCQHCGKVIVGKWEKGKWLDVHHIDQNKQNSDPSNLISLCRSCHRKEHNRLNRLARI